MTGLSRRRFLVIAASTAAAGICGGARAGHPPAPHWRGIALGARAEIRFDGIDAKVADDLVHRCRAEIDRLENLFSLYRRESAISRLNRDGELRNPPAEFLEILSVSRSVHDATQGLFDPTIQVYWTALAERYAASPAAGPEASHPVGTATGLHRVVFDRGRIAFASPGMAITLNGIAQGYITDQITEFLISAGLKHVLVDIGELRAIGNRRDGSDWPVRIVNAGAGRQMTYLNDRALATSSTLGTTFDDAGRIGHIVDPRTGEPAVRPIVRSVRAKRAAVADALSTAFSLMTEDQIRGALVRFPDAQLV